MAEGIGLVLLGVVMCGAAAMRWIHPSWKSPWECFAWGLGLIAIGVALVTVDIAWDIAFGR
jgi:hypothetical protein